MAKTVAPYRCEECGWTTLKWVGRCGECQTWGTVVEAGASATRPRVEAVAVADSDKAKPITEHSSHTSLHQPSGVAEFDRVLGGGIVPGAAILLSGEPGVGKSTLLLEVASRQAQQGVVVLYVSAEESVGQVRLRAERTGALHDKLFLAATTDLGTVLGQVDSVNPGLVIIDSVQTFQAATIDGLAGGVAQVREVASTLIRLAKDRNVPVIMVGHVTKDGQVAGPRTLEHLVDVVCQFEGDRHTALRFVRADRKSVV
jgi:DNA repair protein RadA/Sms